MKDRHAVTTQWLSVPRTCEAGLADVDHPALRILQIKSHRQKLRPGNLWGNRFTIHIEIPPEGGCSDEALRTGWEKACDHGAPNLFGAQRFGERQRNLVAGLKQVEGILNGERGRRLPPSKARLMASAL